MIIHNLHKIKTQELRIKTSLLFFNKLVFYFGLPIKNTRKATQISRSLKKLHSSFVLICLLSSNLYAQDRTVPKINIEEKINFDFQEHFFNAITQKAIYNYKKAIENLQECNQLIPNNKAVLFEFAKNYYKLNKIPEATEYANQALAKEPNNIWMLSLLVSIYEKERNFKEAIITQQKIVKNHPKKKQNLVFLYLKKGDIKSAKRVLSELAEAKMLNAQLRNIQSNLKKTYSRRKEKNDVQTVKNDLKQQFIKDKSFSTLKKLLLNLDVENNYELLSFSREGLTLFPAQPFVYLMNGKALNKKGNYKKAVSSLKNGLDFVIDDRKMETLFYKELVKAYKELGDKKNERKYAKKL